MKTTPIMILTDLLNEIALRYGEIPTPGMEVDPAELRSILDRVLARLDEADDEPCVKQLEHLNG